MRRTLSDYLGLDTMSTIVCKTHDGLIALETYDKEGLIDKRSGLNGLGTSIGRPLDDRYLVICLENLRPYSGEFIADDPESRLAIQKPRYLNKETPRGFLGFAVNVINIDTTNLYCRTSTCHGLRETLFYKLFSRLQVYKIRADMLQELPFIADGAISLDGGIIKSRGISSLGESYSLTLLTISSYPTMDGSQRRTSIDNDKAQLVHDPSLNRGGQINSHTMQNESAEAVISYSKKLEDALQEIGFKIKHHDANIKFLKAQKNRLDDSILDMGGALAKIHSASGTGSENKESSNGQNEEDTIEQIIRYEKSAAGICCQLQTCYRTQITQIPFMKDVIGVVALLGKVDDGNLSRTLSDYLGLKTMLAVVCKTHDGLKALETYDKEGLIDKNSGLYGLGASIESPLDDRYLVICLENLRPYTGEFIADDPQRRLAIEKPGYLNKENPRGFLGFAVNMINIDSANLYCVTSTGHGLRETLFYKLFSRLQVYKTREDMLLALPFIADGAISLDGGIIKSRGISSLGERKVEIVFPKSSGRRILPENYFETKNQMKELNWKRAIFVEDLQREQALLENAKLNFAMKKQVFVEFVAQNSSVFQR